MSGATVGAVDVKVCHCQLGDIGVRDLLTVTLRLREATPILEPLVAHPEPATGIPS